MPSPMGFGIRGNRISKTIMKFAGIEDVSCKLNNGKSKVDIAWATFDAVKKLMERDCEPFWKIDGILGPNPVIYGDNNVKEFNVPNHVMDYRVKSKSEMLKMKIKRKKEKEEKERENCENEEKEKKRRWDHAQTLLDLETQSEKWTLVPPSGTPNKNNKNKTKKKKMVQIVKEEDNSSGHVSLTNTFALLDSPPTI